MAIALHPLSVDLRLVHDLSGHRLDRASGERGHSTDLADSRELRGHCDTIPLFSAPLLQLSEPDDAEAVAEGIAAEGDRGIALKTSLIHLLHGPGSTLERAYDLIYSERWKLARFDESCVMELSGWLDPHRPPVNGRTMKALRYLGFDVPA